jgi:hypothetical protein
MTLIHRYAAWTRRQAGEARCFHVAGLYAAALGAAALLIAANWAVIWPVLVIIFWVAVSCAGLALLGAIAAIAAAARRRAPARRLPRPARPAPACGDCGARATAEVTYANGRRSDTTYTCDACWQAEEHRASSPPQFRQVSVLVTSGLPAWAEIPAPPEPPEVAIARSRGMNPPRRLPDAGAEVPVAPDNAAATDSGTAADLAAVLGRTGQWTRQHP